MTTGQAKKLLKAAKLTHGLSAFLDILGFGAQVTDATTHANLEEILQSIKRIRRAFEHRPNTQESRDIHAAYGKTVLAFSDSVIVNVPLASDMTKIEGVFDALMSELHSMGYAQASLITHGLFMRGGADVGWWYRDGATLVSKSMANAYALEGKACVPVIALSDTLYSFLAKQDGRRAYSEDYDPLRTIVREFKGTVGKAEVNIRFLDYLSIFAREVDWIPSRANHDFLLTLHPDERDDQKEAWRLENLKYWFSGHARTVEAGYHATNSESVKDKYRWLASYHNDVAPYFTADDPACACVL